MVHTESAHRGIVYGRLGTAPVIVLILLGGFMHGRHFDGGFHFSTVSTLFQHLAERVYPVHGL